MYSITEHWMKMHKQKDCIIYKLGCTWEHDFLKVYFTKQFFMDVSKLHVKRESPVGKHYCDPSGAWQWLKHTLPFLPWLVFKVRGSLPALPWVGQKWVSLSRDNWMEDTLTSATICLLKSMSLVLQYVPRVHLLFIWISGFQMGTLPLPQGHVALSGDIFDCHNGRRGVLLASKR